MSTSISLYLNIFLLAVIVSLTFAKKTELSYEEQRSLFKQSLYERQQGVLEEADYKAFVEPYLQEAEAKLVLCKHFAHKSYNGWSGRYFAALLNYSAAYFQAYAKMYSGAREACEAAEKELFELISLIKQKEELSFDEQKEFAQTKELFVKMNKKFYKKLGIGIRLYNFFRTMGS